MAKKSIKTTASQISLFDDESNLPISTVHQSRLQMYQPTKKPKNIKQVIETAWGSAIIDGRIGQVHAGLMEAIFKHTIDKRAEQNGSLTVLVDPYKVRTTTYGGSQGSYEQIWVMLKDLMKCVVEFNIPGKSRKDLGHILEHVTESPMTRENPLTGEARKMWRITIAAGYLEWIGRDLALFYDPEPIARLETGIAQAVVRHLEGHKRQPPGGWHIDALINAVGAGKTSQNMRDSRRYLLKDREAMKSLGYVIGEGRVKKDR